jgi:prevent-host-death family protein
MQMRPYLWLHVKDEWSNDTMKFITVRDAKATLSNAIAESQDKRVVITKHGKPVCILIGCEGYEIEDVLTAADPAFWKMIEERRSRGRTHSLESVRRRFANKNISRASKTKKSTSRR